MPFKHQTSQWFHDHFMSLFAFVYFCCWQNFLKYSVFIRDASSIFLFVSFLFILFYALVLIKFDSSAGVRVKWRKQEKHGWYSKLDGLNAREENISNAKRLRFWWYAKQICNGKKIYPKKKRKKCIKTTNIYSFLIFCGLFSVQLFIWIQEKKKPRSEWDYEK